MTENENIVSATVFSENDQWFVRFWDSAGDEVAVEPVSWDGEGSFYEEGLNRVVHHLTRRNLAYRGSGAWDALDGAYTAVMHQPDPRFT